MRRHGISDATFYTWRSKYGGLEISELRRLRQLEEENRRLKSIVADQALDIRALKDVLAKTVTARCEARDGGRSYGPHALSQRRACGLIGITRRSFQRAAAEERNHQLRQRLRELAEQRRRWGCPMLYLVLRREGWRANHKRVERLYREEGLSLRRRRRRKRLSHLRVVRERPVAANQTWAVDFIHDSLISSRRFRAFAVLDEWSRESLAIEVDVSLTGERVTRVLDDCVAGVDAAVIQSDNGPELRGRMLDHGPMRTACGCSSLNRASRFRTRPSRLQCALTRGMSQRACLCFTRRCAHKSNNGVSSTIANVPIRASVIWPLRSSQQRITMSLAVARTAWPAADQELAGAPQRAPASDPKLGSFSATLGSV